MVARPKATPTEPYEHRNCRIYPPTAPGRGWRVLVTDLAGKRMERRAKSQAEAEERAGELSHYANGSVIWDRGQATVATLADEYVAEMLQRVDNDELAIRYYEKHESSLRLHVKPVLGPVKVKDWTDDDSREVLARLNRTGCGKDMRQAVGSAMRQMVTYAHKRRYLPDHLDPMKGVPYSKKSREQGQKAEFVARETLPTQEDVDALVKGFQANGEHALATATALLACSGLRYGEWVALRPKDINLEKRTIRVERSVVRSSSRPAHFGPPKHDKERTTFFVKSLTEPLAALCETAELMRGRDGLLFPGTVRPWPEYTTMRRKLIRAAQTAGWPFEPPDPSTKRQQWPAPRWGYHDLRHFAACWMIYDLRMEIPNVSHHLGHESHSLTFDTYVGVRGDIEATAKALTEGW